MKGPARWFAAETLDGREPRKRAGVGIVGAQVAGSQSDIEQQQDAEADAKKLQRSDVDGKKVRKLRCIDRPRRCHVQLLTIPSMARRTFLITGATKGIGLAIARRLHER